MNPWLVVAVITILIFSMLKVGFDSGYMVGMESERLMKQVVFETIQEKNNYLKLLHKHGLDNDVSCIEMYRNKMYFYRDGERIELK